MFEVSFWVAVVKNLFVIQRGYLQRKVKGSHPSFSVGHKTVRIPIHDDIYKVSWQKSAVMQLPKIPNS